MRETATPAEARSTVNTQPIQTQPIQTQPIQTEAELALLKRYLLLRVAVQILDHDIGIVAASEMKLPQLYESMLRALQDRVLLEQAAAKRQMIADGIRITEERRHAEGVAVQYSARGYQHQFTLQWPVVRREAERLLGDYRRGRTAGREQRG